MPNREAYRVIKNSIHNLLLDNLKWAYSSSANKSGNTYNKNYAENNTEVIVKNPNSSIKRESRILQLSKFNIKKKIR